METALSKGTTLQKGKYTIVKSLGQGSFGITYLATTKLTMMGKLGQMDTTVNVAIKEFFMSEMNSRSKDGSSIEGSSGSLFSNYRQKFKKEAENLSKLDHSNIVNVLDVFDENNTTYYVMQYIDGQSLDDYILQQDGINESKAISILKEIGKAVQYMHSNKMLHLDLKPKNVMLDKDGIVYLIDFGLSKQYDEKGEPESSTKVGAGTPGYAPIEQANYREGKGFPVTMDVYALGATMFKMLTSIRPPEASDILNDGFPLYELQEHGIDERISASIAKAMAPTKKDRYQTIDDFIDSFEEEATVIDVEVSSRKDNSKSKISYQNLYTILPTTKKVEISFIPTFPIVGIMYDAIVKGDEIQIRSGAQKATWDISRKAFSKFLTSLNSLSLNVRKKENPEYMEASETADKLTITLYDDNNSVYAKYWIGGWKNQFGNIIGETQKTNEKVKKIIPHLEDFLKEVKLKLPVLEDFNLSFGNANKKDDEKVVRSEKVKKFLQITPDTSKVRIEYWPYSLFPPQYNGAFITTVTPYEVNPNITQESTREMIPMTQDKYKFFLNALQSLKLEIREEIPEQVEPGSFSPAKLKMSLYDKNGIVYKDLWIDGMNGGNIVGNVDVIEKQIIQIVPGLSRYLNGPFYEVPDSLKGNKNIKADESPASINSIKYDENGKISYKWLTGLFSLSTEIALSCILFYVFWGFDRLFEYDSAMKILQLSAIWLSPFFAVVYYLFRISKRVTVITWRRISFLIGFVWFINSLMIFTWRSDLIEIVFFISIGLSIISSFTILIKKSV